MILLLVGLLLFFGAHSVSIVAPQWRDRIAQHLGANAWRGIYTVVSIIGFVLIIKGYAAARTAPTVLYVPPAGLRHVAAALMLPVFIMLLATYLPGRIKSTLKHPTLVATKLWAVAHLLANGTLADVLLFGTFLAWAVLDRISLKKRVVRPLPGAPPSQANDVIAIVGGLALYAVFALWLHTAWIGVRPFG